MTVIMKKVRGIVAFVVLLCSRAMTCYLCNSFIYDWILPGGVVGNMLASHTVNPGSIPGWGGYIVTRMITIMAVPCHWIPSGT